MNGYIMNDAETKLVAALRSGKYTQVIGWLHYGEGYCCLGVACDLFPGSWTWRKETDNEWALVNEDKTERFGLTEHARVTLNWSLRDGLVRYPCNTGYITLAELNDAGMPFDQIADLIAGGLICHEGEEPETDPEETDY